MTRIIGSLYVTTKKGEESIITLVSSTKLRPANSLGGSHVEKHVLLKHRERVGGTKKKGFTYHTERTGMRYLGSTYAKYEGKAPSRAHAHVSLETEATEPMVPEIMVVKIPPSMADAPATDWVALRQMSMRG